jgi:hypothetical protein
MKKETITRIKLTASEGHMLTDGENYGRIVYLASGDDGEKWYEITEEAYENKMRELEEKSEIMVR